MQRSLHQLALFSARHAEQTGKLIETANAVKAHSCRGTGRRRNEGQSNLGQGHSADSLEMTGIEQYEMSKDKRFQGETREKHMRKYLLLNQSTKQFTTALMAVHCRFGRIQVRADRYPLPVD